MWVEVVEMKGIRAYLVMFALIVSGFSFEAQAQLPYGFSPDWRSADRNYATGGQFADIDRDGWLDWVVSNGNDMRRERVAVYYNRGGILETSPSWTSSDIAYHGHLAIGDINQDGWLDVVVAVLLPQGGPGVKVYLNHQGQLSPSPDWVSAVSFYGWHPALGDPDGDGDLDLAIGGSWPYGSGQMRHFIFFNRNGVLESTPSWQVVGIRDVAQFVFYDVDLDGDQDLVGIAREGNLIYRNHNGTISTTHDWISSDNNRQFPNTLAIGDITGDGYPDLIMSDNNQISGGSGRFKFYANSGSGVFETSPSWSYYDGYVSAVALADLNNDGWLDFVGGKWWGPARIFLNRNGILDATPVWSSAVQPVVEAICFGDINRDGIVQGVYRSYQQKKLHYLGRQPIERLHRVVVDGNELPPTEYCYHLLNGWVSLRNIPHQEVVIEFEYSILLDMGITDWDRRGNILFYHRPIGDVDGNNCVDDADLLRVLFAFGQNGTNLPEDLNLDGHVDDADLLTVLFHFGL